MRKVLFTESQIKKILGEDFLNYLPNVMDGGEEPENNQGYEITTSDKDKDKQSTAVPTADKMSNQHKGNRGFYGCYGSRQGHIQESYTDDKGKKGLGHKQTISRIADNMDTCNTQSKKVAQSMINGEKVSKNTARMRAYRENQKMQNGLDSPISKDIYKVNKEISKSNYVPQVRQSNSMTSLSLGTSTGAKSHKKNNQNITYEY